MTTKGPIKQAIEVIVKNDKGERITTNFYCDYCGYRKFNGYCYDIDDELSIDICKDCRNEILRKGTTKTKLIYTPMGHKKR
jgi:DNA-directed RNA polymerase subunit RPC12/RpoP